MYLMRAAMASLKDPMSLRKDALPKSPLVVVAVVAKTVAARVAMRAILVNIISGLINSPC